jgi:hypothetical protein
MVSGAGATRTDDPTIGDAEDLLRRVARDWIVTEQATQRRRLSSAAFRDGNQEISVDLSSLTTPPACLSRGGPSIVGVVSVTAGQARNLKQGVARDPIPEDPAHAIPEDPAHAVIFGEQNRATCKGLASCAKWVFPPESNPLDPKPTVL